MQEKSDNILEFKNKFETKQQITEEDLKSLFMGIIKLIKNTYKAENDEKLNQQKLGFENQEKNLNQKIETLTKYSESLFSENLKLKNEIENLKNKK